ncbi:TPA: hemagglutinin repeat-containing protein [Pasteurella multocida]|nr:hemagglutinin repeat-containing protein [Pasteurella multocida]
MNKHCYRVIFSKTQQQFIVVSEIAKTAGQAKSEGKISAETESMKTLAKLTALFSPIPQSVFQPLSFALLCAWGLVSMQSAYANPTNSPLMIQADPTAQANQRPQVMEAANGTPQVNIQTPNQQGLSYNRYSQFDVDKKGAILNNSRKDTQTQLGGWVQANPYLAGGEAKVIVNEVNSNKPSQLKGYVEVAGQKADVIIANPSGLHCEGCGVINADRATLTTGKPQLKQGHLDHFVVEKGKVTVSGKGLDNSQSNYTDIIAREAEINAGVWSKKAVNVTTGKNKVSKNNDAVQIIHSKSQNNQKEENVTEYALDVSNLGGMYAEKIHLIGTEAGLGVRNAGHIGASAGDVVIDVNGKIVNQHRIQAQQHVILNAKGDKGTIDNMASAQVLANQGRINVQAEKTLTQSGVIGAKQQIAVQAEAITQSKTGEIQGGEVRLTAQGQVVNRGLVNSQTEQPISTAKTVIQASHIQNVGTGRIYGDHVALMADSLHNHDETTETTSSPIIAARKRLDLGVKQITNQNHQYSGNTTGATALYSDGSLHVGAGLDAQDKVMGQAAVLNNHSALIESQGNMQLNVAKIHNTNDFFATELQVISEQEVDWHYIVPQGVAESELRFDTRLLHWRNQSRGRNGWVVNSKPKAIHKPHNGDVQSNYLPEVNQCMNGTQGAGCEFLIDSYYFPHDPAWQYFAIKPSIRDNVASLLNEAKVPVAPIAPVEPVAPTNPNANAQQEYEEKLAQYQQQKAIYDNAYQVYLQEKAHFDEKVKPAYLQWVKDNENHFTELSNAIVQHNQRRASAAGRDYRNYWSHRVNRQVVKEDVVIQTQAGAILAGGDLKIDTQQFVNDKSRVLTGGQLQLQGDLFQRQADGLQFTESYGSKYYSYLRKRKSKTSSGRNKYQRRNERWYSGLLSNTQKSITLPVANVFEQYEFDQDSLVIKSTGEHLALPNSSLYKLNPAAESHVLVETDSAFTNRKKWLSSDYMFNMLRADHNLVHKRLGDGYYEQRLIRDQINQLTGRQFLGNHQDMETQYKALMDNGITFAKKFHLTPGISLSPEQVAQLTSDIVWFEQQTVTLPDGSTQQVLAPRVYAVVQKGDVTSQGTLLSANHVDLHAHTIRNQGTIAGRKIAILENQQLTNLGTLTGDLVHIQTDGDVINQGNIRAEHALSLDVGGDLIQQSTTQTSHVNAGHYRQSDTHLDRKALLHVTGKEGTLQVSAKNIQLIGADILNEGLGDTTITAKNQLKLTALETVKEEKIGHGDHYRHERVQDVIVSHVKGAGDVKLQAYNIATEGAKLESTKKLTALAENDLVLNAAVKRLDYDEYHHTKSGSFISKTKQTSYDAINASTHQGSQLVAQDIVLQAGNQLNSAGLAVKAKQAIQADAKTIELGTVTDQRHETHWSKRSKSGLAASAKGGVATVGYQRSNAGSHHNTFDETLKVSHLEAEGDIRLNANDALTLNATQLQAEQDIYLVGKTVDINAVDETHRNRYSRYSKASGIGINMVYNPIAVGRDKYQQREQQGATKGIIGQITGIKAITDTVEMTARGLMPYIKHQRSQANQFGEQTVAKTAEIDSKGDLKIFATGGDITTQGSQISVGKTAEFNATGNVNFDVATDRYRQNADAASRAAELNGLNKYVAGIATSRQRGNQSLHEEKGTLISVGGDSQVIAQEGNITGKGLSLVSEGKNELKAKGNVILETARTEQNGVQGRKSHGIGELTISETEHFFGYHRERYNQEGDTLTHQGSQIASLNSHVKIEAGQDYRQVSSSLLAKDTLDVTAQNLYFDATHNLQRHQQSQSDLKIGQFSRIKSPIIDMIQTTERLVKNKAASDRLKVANAMGLAAQGYALYDNINKIANQRYSSAYLLRVESGVGVAHSRQKQEVEMRISQGNLLNAAHIHLNAGTDKTASTSAEAGNIRLTHTTLTSRDDKGQRIAGSTLSLTGRQIDIHAGESRTKERSRGQNIGAEVGVFAQFGPQSGVGAYATLGGGNQKVNGDSLSYHNSQLDSEHVTLRSRQDMHLVGAKVQGKRVDIEAGGNLHIESRQDESRFDSRSTQAGVNAEMSFGNAWSANGNVSAERGKSNYKQVRELSGIMAEEGGYHVMAENVHLKGAVIASTNPAQSELTTNRFSFEDIKNESSYSASSASISGGYSKGREYYRDADTHKVVSAGSKNAEFIAGKKGANFNAGLPMHSEGSEESLTKATLTAGRITLNKDSQPIETTADALGINTDLSQAQREVSKPKDVTQLLAEHKAIAKAVGEIKSAVEIYTSNQQEEAELAVKRAKKALAQAEQTGNQAEITQKQTALFAAEEAQAKWGDKGEYKRTAERLTTLLTGILAKQAAGGIATQLISPEVNQWIKEATTNDKGETDKIANTLAHAIWGAIEATANRGNPTSGALAAASAELAAPMLAKVLYNKDKAEQLTAEEKAQITALSSMTAAVAGGLTAQGSRQSNTTVSSLTHASIGGEIGKIAVENNFLLNKQAEKYLTKEEKELFKKLKAEGVEDIEQYQDAYLQAETKEERKQVIQAYQQAVEAAGEKIVALYKQGVLSDDDYLALASSFASSISRGIRDAQLKGKVNSNAGLLEQDPLQRNAIFWTPAGMMNSEHLAQLNDIYLDKQVQAGKITPEEREIRRERLRLLAGSVADINVNLDEMIEGIKAGDIAIVASTLAVRKLLGKKADKAAPTPQEDVEKLGKHNPNWNPHLNERISQREAGFYLKEQRLNKEASQIASSISLPIKAKVWLTHIINGERKGNLFVGGHTTLGNVIVDKVIKEYPNGVYEARVLIPNPKAKTDPDAPKFLEKLGKNKDSASMMFPRTWTEDRLKVELEHAFRNRSRVEKTENTWSGTTKSGVKVEWVINKDGYLSTVYPTREQ